MRIARPPFRQILQCERGTIVVLFSLLLPILAMGAVGVAELAEVMLAKSKLQSYVDAAAIQGAGEFGVDQSTATMERARLYADTMAAPLRLRWTIASTAAVNAAARTVTVSLAAHRASFFGSLLPPGGWSLAATATAIRTARKPLCVLGSHADNQDSVTVTDSSEISARDCVVQSNANLTVARAAALSAGEARASGSASGAILPAPITDAPPITDPFANLAIRVPLLCGPTFVSIGGGTTYLKPGVHCGGISLLGNATIVLEPGEHYFVGPSLSIGGQTSITGSDVVVILKGLETAQFTANSVLQLEGRKSGPYAGFVLITDRSYTGKVEISTNNARKLLGTIYFPNADLPVKGNNKVADQSAWTVIVARHIRTEGNARLTVNSSYSSSTIPVPAGVGPPRDQPVRLSQ